MFRAPCFQDLVCWPLKKSKKRTDKIQHSMVFTCSVNLALMRHRKIEFSVLVTGRPFSTT